MNENEENVQEEEKDEGAKLVWCMRLHICD